MANLASLPVEIQRQCITYLPTAALKEIRLTSRAFRDIATEVLFDEVTIRVTQESADNFTALIKKDDFRSCIRTLYIDTLSNEQDLSYECESSTSAKWWKTATEEWGSIDLPNLRSLTIDNAYTCADGLCTSIDRAFTTFLSSASIDTVTIKHLQDSCRVQRPTIAQFPATLRKLNLLVATWSDMASSDMDIELDFRHSFFNIILNATWLNPLQSQLTHLTLHCNTYWGVYPRWQPNDLHFPQLKSLSFGKWTIAFDWQIEFITSHGQTLEQLNLTNCPILHALRMIPRQSRNGWHEPLPGTGRGKPRTEDLFTTLRWHTVLPELQTKLPKLKHFSMFRGPRGDTFWGRTDHNGDEAFDDRYRLAPCIDASRYAVFDYDQGPSEWIEGHSEYAMSRFWTGKPKPDGWECSSWLEEVEKLGDEEMERKVRFPDCWEEDREALGDLLAALRGR